MGSGPILHENMDPLVLHSCKIQVPTPIWGGVSMASVLVAMMAWVHSAYLGAWTLRVGLHGLRLRANNFGEPFTTNLGARCMASGVGHRHAEQKAAVHTAAGRHLQRC